jgi:hypothetical protein
MNFVLSTEAPRDSSKIAELLANERTSHVWAMIASGVALLSALVGLFAWWTEGQQTSLAEEIRGMAIVAVVALLPLFVHMFSRYRLRRMRELVTYGELVRGEVVAHTKIHRASSSWPVFGVVVRFATRDEFDRQAPLSVFNFDREIPFRVYGPFPAVRFPVGTVIWGFFDPKRKKSVFPSLHQVEVSFVNRQDSRPINTISAP